MFKQIVEELNSFDFISDLRKAGKVYLVGGMVRDIIMKKESKDIDLLVTGIPIVNLKLTLKKYGNVVESSVGNSFGVLKFKPFGWKKDAIDIALPRTEKKTGFGHAGFFVNSDHNLSVIDDLKRRDFTINAMAVDLDGNIIDPHGGMYDIEEKYIVPVNSDTFVDDPLRMMRAVRFRSILKDFKYDELTYLLIKKHAPLIKEITGERIKDELDKVYYKGNLYTCLTDLIETGLYKQIFHAYHHKDCEVGYVTVADFYYELLLYSGQRSSVVYSQVLKGDNKIKKQIEAVEYIHSKKVKGISELEKRKILSTACGISTGILLCKVPNSIYNNVIEFLSGKYPKSILDLKIDGNIILENTQIEKIKLGAVKRKLLELVYDDKLKNEENELLEFVKNLDVDALD